jgi:flagellar export protein FliJ
MPFRFSLATVLNLREQLEQREMLLLERRYAELAAVQGRLWEAAESIVRAQQQQADELKAGTTAFPLQLIVETIKALERHRATLQLNLQEAQLRLREQLGKYRQARQKRDVLEELRQQQFDYYQREQGKMEQRECDELFLLRLQHKR